MTRKQGDRINPQFLTQGSPLNATIAETIFRRDATTDLSALTTQVMLSAGIALQAGDVVSNLTFISGATAAGTPTNWWFALFSNAATPALLAQTADQTTTAWAANTIKTVALATAQTITVPGIYFAAIMMKATTPVSLVGKAVQNAVVAGAVLTGFSILAQTSGSALTTTAPSTIASPTTVANIPYAIAS